MLRLKADLHTHCADDPRDAIGYSAEMLIDAVSKLNVQVLAIACHSWVAYNDRLAEYARRRNVVLIPAAELDVDGKHIVALNPDGEQAAAKTFAELRRMGKRNAAFFPSHPFYWGRVCIGGDVMGNADLFDAIEYSGVYLRFLNPNRRGVRAAQALGLPLVGNSDTHALPYCGNTFSWIEAEEASVDAVIDAIRKGRVFLDSKPCPFALVFKAAAYSIQDLLKSQMRRFR